MTTEHELLDPRFDPEPGYWAEVRQRAGLRADWAWDVLAVQAWCARTPQYISVFRDRGVPTGVAASAWVGTPTRRYRFAGAGRGGRIGGLDVRSPGSSALPGYWFADAGGAGELLERFVPAMRRELGAGVRGLLLRQIDSADVSHVDGRWRMVRRTEDATEIPIAGFGSVEDWLATLRKKRRHNLRRISQRVAEGADLEVTVGPLSASDAVESASLLRHNEDKHRDVPIVPLPQFVGYLERLFDRSDVVGVRYRDTDTGKLVGLGLLYDHSARPLVRSWAGLPPELGGRRDLYFHFYVESVRWAIAAGRDGLLLGKKMAEMKQTLGATLLPQYAAAIPLR